MAMDVANTESLSSELLALALRVANQAGELLMNRPPEFDINQKSSARDFATHMDHASEALIVKALLEARPEDGIIGEEDTDRQSRSGITWVIDPIDGTVNYFYGLPGWNISIAAKDSDGAVVGVVHAPSINTTWHGVRGGGAFKNGQPIRANQGVALADALVATGFSYHTDRRARQGATIARLIPRVRDIRRFGAAAVDLCNVASGSVDAYFEIDLKEWDLAAGALIAREAGALVTGLDGGEPGEAMTIAASPALHAVLLQELIQAD